MQQDPELQRYLYRTFFFRLLTIAIIAGITAFFAWLVLAARPNAFTHEHPGLGLIMWIVAAGFAVSGVFLTIVHGKRTLKMFRPETGMTPEETISRFIADSLETRMIPRNLVAAYMCLSESAKEKCGHFRGFQETAKKADAWLDGRWKTHHVSFEIDNVHRHTEGNAEPESFTAAIKLMPTGDTKKLYVDWMKFDMVREQGCWYISGVRGTLFSLGNAEAAKA